MSKALYAGIEGIARKVKKMYIGVNGIARKVKKAYIGINGIARLFFAGGGHLCMLEGQLRYLLGIQPVRLTAH